MEATQKCNYFYIDESGSISNNSSIFIHGCIKTDSPQTITESLLKLKDEIKNSLYYDDFKEKIIKQGFHATENNLDMRADFYKLLPLLDYRAYFVITNKDTEYFKNKMKNMDESEYFAHSLKKLITDRVVANKNDKNIFYFETIQLTKKTLKQNLDAIFSQLNTKYNCEFYIVGKEEENLAIVDYLNFIFYHLFVDDKPMQRMKQNFNLVSPKIALVYFIHNKLFFSRRKPKQFEVSLKNLYDNY
ncbi:DUF3800 domain-containing protein [Flavobacterium soyae]|uniref:DUF3800 domain-containing protein n=1 Tax=Flavobacterium soyae TaxID=2903098 RepID=UPI001E47C4BC|nr:DUF3800 domain-containing protein [Flavobacterium soyae]MCD9577043.1 hypothetical protein [Flavobacterium soyae]